MQIALTFLMPAYPDCPRKRMLNMQQAYTAFFLTTENCIAIISVLDWWSLW